MPLQPLPPDDLERRIGAHPNLLKPCPFCGRPAHLHSAVNQVVRYGQRLALYQGVVACSDHQCFGQVMQNQRSREQAQQSAMAQWNRRVPATA